MANTVIRFRRSSVTSAPAAGSLAAGVPSYSFNVDKLYLGNTTGDGILIIGGAYYTGIVDGATSANNANNLVKRDANGDFQSRFITADQFRGNLFGAANTANALTTGRYIALTGDATANTIFDGTTNINLNVDLTDTGVVAGTYGEGISGAQIPVFTVDIEGRITSAANVATPAGATFTYNGNTGTDVATAGDRINIINIDGLTTDVAANTGNTIVKLSVDSTVVRTTGTQSIGGLKTFTTDLTVTGNLVVNGTTVYANTTQLNVGDNTITLNADLPIGTAPSQDAGIEINRGNLNSNAAFLWDETNDWWTAQGNVLLSGASALGRIHTDSYANATALTVGTVPSARLAGSYTGITGLGTITVGTWNGALINVQYGGTGSSTFTLNGVLYSTGANGAILNTAAGVEGKVLQASVSGVPVFADVDGGTY